MATRYPYDDGPPDIPDHHRQSMGAQGCPEDDCICPECPECGGTGDPKCYKKHGLIRSPEQIKQKAEREAAWKAEVDAENAALDQWAKEMEEQCHEPDAPEGYHDEPEPSPYTRDGIVY
jgi:hypothetical protein